MSPHTQAGFIATVGRPNAGKSTLLNSLSGCSLALVSHKANATRKRMQFIIMHNNSQLIFIDTPGLHREEKLLNRFMLQESLKAMSDCDVILFIAPVLDDLTHYETFLSYNQQLAKPKKHIILLSKIDCATHKQIAQKLQDYTPYQNEFEAIIPIDCKSKKENYPKSFSPLLDTLAKLMPSSPYLYDTYSLTTNTTREIAKELIREALFDNLSDEVPYCSEVIIKDYKEKPILHHIHAQIVVEKDSQKSLVIGKNGSTIKRIGIQARKKIESLVENSVFLQLEVTLCKNWTKDRDKLKSLGYDLVE